MNKDLGGIALLNNDGPQTEKTSEHFKNNLFFLLFYTLSIV